jgi:hypothetical protein
MRVPITFYVEYMDFFLYGFERKKGLGFFALGNRQSR